MNIVMVASEAVPYAKTGGLADVVGSLAPSLARAGHDVTLILPLHRSVRTRLRNVRVVDSLRVVVNNERVSCTVLEDPSAAPLRVLLIDQPGFFDREGMYVDQFGRDYADNSKRFCFFCRAALDIVQRLNLQVDSFHLHDWQTGLIPVYARTLYREHQIIGKAGTVFTIHNLAFQGRFPAQEWSVTGLEEGLFSVEGLEFWNDWSMIKGAILWADQITTVSPTYAKEILEPEDGYGLEGVIRRRAHRLVGITNGIDIDLWNPMTDPNLTRNYDRFSWHEGKGACKKAFQESKGLAPLRDAPLVGMVGRMTYQKGTDLVVQIAKNLLNMPIQLAILGSGDAALENVARQFGRLYADRIWVNIGFNESLAHEVYAASDWFLMPSRFEPCGLSQLYALRYGSVPIVHAVGGLIDTVQDATPNNLENGVATGFHFSEIDPSSLLAAIARARDAFQNPNIWSRIVETGMKKDWSWARSAAAYEEVYRRAKELVRES
jgi:starch synthase